VKNRHLYPDNWEYVSLFVRGKADWKCQACGKRCRSSGEPIQAFINRVDADLEAEIRKHPIRYCLTVAHLNHKPMDCRIENLMAMCAPCHLKYDAEYHAEQRKINRYKLLEKNGQLTLF
jgi:hypothetical protein